MALYAIALGSNRPHGRHGTPAEIVSAAIDTLRKEGIRVRAVSPIFPTAPVGPSIRAYANAAALIETPLDPPALLGLLKRTERAFGRRRGQRWGARVIDLDIVLWSGGTWHDATLVVPHVAFRERRFVLDCLVRVAADWRDPVTGLTVRHLHARLTRPRPLRR